MNIFKFIAKLALLKTIHPKTRVMVEWTRQYTFRKRIVDVNYEKWIHLIIIKTK